MVGRGWAPLQQAVVCECLQEGAQCSPSGDAGHGGRPAGGGGGSLGTDRVAVARAAGGGVKDVERWVEKGREGERKWEVHNIEMRKWWGSLSTGTKKTAPKTGVSWRNCIHWGFLSPKFLYAQFSFSRE